MFCSWSHFRTFTISIHALLSSKIVQCILGVVSSIGKISLSSCNKFIIGIASLIECDNTIYSLSVLDRLICVCSFDSHIIGHPAYVIKYPVLENTDDGSYLQD